jgi:hypothetical protein
MTIVVRAWILVIAVAGLARGDGYARDHRVAHLALALAELRAADPRPFERALHEGVRAGCRTANRPPTTACMAGVARALCRTPGCLAAADIVLANQHAEADLIDEATRMRFVQRGGEYHAAVLAELARRYALLAAELAMFAPRDPDLAGRIDRFCARRDEAVHRCGDDRAARSCIPSLPWQRCAAGLVWYIATAGAPR